MIKANELRIGNWVEFCGKYFTLRSIDTIPRLRPSWGGFSQNPGLEDLNPVLLTPDIFEMCGMVRHKEIYFIHENNFGVKLVRDEYFLMNTELQRKGYKYLHQLQNVYFDLVGAELQVKLEIKP